MTQEIRFTEPVEYDGTTVEALSIEWHSDVGDVWEVETTAGEQMTFNKDIVDGFGEVESDVDPARRRELEDRY